MILNRYLQSNKTNATQEGVREEGKEEESTAPEAEPPESTTTRTNNNSEDNSNPHKKTTEQSDSNEKIKDSLPTIEPTQAERRNIKTTPLLQPK